MKILIMGDFHYTLKQPGSRRDNVGEVFDNKFAEICSLVSTNEVDVLVQPGDLFDSHKANDETKSAIMNIFNHRFPKEKTDFLTIFGQHDLRYHQSNIMNTPLHLLNVADYVKILGHRPLRYNKGKECIDFYGASWFEEIPAPEKKDNFNILVIHKMVIDEKIWEGQEDFVRHNILLKTQRDYDLIICGDNHKTFTAQSGNRFLVNPGCLIRTRIDQEDHRPCVFYFDTVIGELQKYNLSIDPFNEVIRYEEGVKEKEENHMLERYAAALKSNTQLTGINYRKNVHKYIKENGDEVTLGMQNFIKKVFKRAEEKNTKAA